MSWKHVHVLAIGVMCCLYGSVFSETVPNDEATIFCDLNNKEEICVDATLCATIAKELLQTDNNLTHAQFKYCHHKEENDPSKYGYGPIKGAKGQPMVCCHKDNIHKFDKNKVCSEKMPALRDEMCGRPSVFYINLPVWVYLVSKYSSYRDKTFVSTGWGCFHFNRDLVHQKRKRCIGPNMTSIIPWKTARKRRRAMNGYIANTGQRVARNSEGRRQKRFTGGKPARMGQFPFMAVLYFTGVFEHNSYVGCLGTIIHQSIVLTTYNCLLKGAILEIWAGKFSVSNDTHEPQEYQWINTVMYKVEPEPQRRLFMHALAPPAAKFLAKHNGTLLNSHDFLMIRVDKPFEYNDFVQPVCLHVTPHSLTRRYESRGIAIGYGLNSEFKDKGRMRYSELERVDAMACQKRYSEYYEKEIDITTLKKEYEYFCYGGNGEETGPCSIDEGSPLIRVDEETGHMYQWGLLLQQVPGTCGLRDLPAMYIAVQVHYKWFEFAIPKILQMQTPEYNRWDPHQCLTDNEKKVLKL